MSYRSRSCEVSWPRQQSPRHWSHSSPAGSWPVEIVSLTGEIVKIFSNSINLNFMNCHLNQCSVQCTADLTDTIIQRTDFEVQYQNLSDFRL